MDIIYGIIFFIYAWLFGDVTFTEIVSFIVIFLLTWFIIGKTIIKIFKLNKSKSLTFITMFMLFILNMYNADIYFKWAKKINHKTSISMIENKKALEFFEEKYPDDDFYTISPMSKGEYGDYYGSFYSKKLKELKYSDYFNIHIEYGHIDKNYSFGNYKRAFVSAERNRFLEKELSKILGNRIKVRLGLDEEVTLDKILENATDKNSNETIRIWYFSVYVFLDGEETKENYPGKINDISKYLFEDLKFSGYNFSVEYVDSRYLNDYESAKSLIYSPLQDDEKGIKILEKLKRKEKITEEEKVYLIQLFGHFSRIPINSSDNLGNKIPE